MDERTGVQLVTINAFPLKDLPPLILASKSLRRQELLRMMDVEFTVVLRDVDESYPSGLSPEEVAVYIAEKKARSFGDSAGASIVLTADTIVAVDGQILGKPENAAEAGDMLRLLSGKVHRVVTGVCLYYREEFNLFHDVSEVFFRLLDEEEIRGYVDRYHPMDKAGAYGIQEWIGLIGIERISGSYTNVVGLPTQKLYQQLRRLV